MPAEPTITVVIDQPFDWVSNVLIPVAAILISALIAVGLAAAERRAGESARRRAEVAILSRTLSDLAVASRNGRVAESNELTLRAYADLNVLAIHLDRRSIPVLKFVSAVLDHSSRRGIASVAATAPWLASVVEAWMRGDLQVRQFQENMPSNANALWTGWVDLRDWEAPPEW